jgi:hypothetical protein
MAFSRSQISLFRMSRLDFRQTSQPVQVGDRVGVKLNINGTEQDIVLIAIEAATTNSIGFVVKITGGAYLTDLQIRDNFVNAISGYFIRLSQSAINWPLISLPFLAAFRVCRSSTQVMFIQLLIRLSPIL